MVTETVLDQFEKWKSFLHDRVEKARKAGMSDETIANLAYQIGEFLDEHVDPKNEEERLLKELWDVGDEQERKTIARLMMKLVDKVK
jgi:hypothetical protein